MAHTDLAQQTSVEHGLLTLLMEGLSNTLAWKVQDNDFARKLSTLRFITQSFQRHLERVLALEEYDGYIDLALQASPQLGNTVDALRQEHEQFRKEARQIVHRLENVAPTDGDLFGRICDELVGLLNRLHTHNKKELNLFQVAFAQDEGGEG
jgi:Hemerythrin HHE cation binding domain